MIYKLPREDTLQHVNTYIQSFFFLNLLYVLTFLPKFKVKLTYFNLFYTNILTVTVCFSYRYTNIYFYIYNFFHKAEISLITFM